MKKALLLIILVIFAAGWSPVDFLPVFKNLRSDIVGQLNDMFDREVSVESVSGTLVNQIELNNVRIAKEKKLTEGSIINAKKIIINYNPFKLAASRGNIVAAISRIEIIEPEVFVERSADDHWNMADLIPRTKPGKGKEKPKPLTLNATIVLKDGRGKYIDHEGWGEDLKGKAFVSGIQDLYAEVKIAGNKINLMSSSATSVIGKSVAYTQTTGDLNTKTGKYKFVVIAKNVDIEKWGYYTLNIPHFKPLTGKSDMKLTMTNPPPRKKGLPIFFDGQFYIKNGKALIFERMIENMNGFIHVHDEDASFRNLSGTRDKVSITANGRLYDFSVAYYDINLELARTDFKKVARAFPEISGIDLSGLASAKVHVGGDYGHPRFTGSAEAEGKLLGQQIAGKLNFSSDGPVLRMRSENVSAYGGKISSAGIFDFTPQIPDFAVAVSGEGLSFKDAVPGMRLQNKFILAANIHGSVKSFMIEAKANTSSGEISASGTMDDGKLAVDLAASNISLIGDLFSGRVETMKGRATGPVNDLTFESDFVLGECMLGPQPAKEIRGSLRLNGGEADVTDLIIATENSRLTINGRRSSDGTTLLHIETVSAEAGELAILDPMIPAELKPVKGKLDLSIDIGAKITNEARIDPQKLQIDGRVALRDGTLGQEEIKEAVVNLHMDDSRISLKDSTVTSAFTNVTLNGTIEPKGKIDLHVIGDLDLSNLKPFTLKYGRFFGLAKIDCRLDGKLSNPDIDADFDVSDLRYNDIILDRVTGRIVYDGSDIFLMKPLDISQDDDRYTLSGKYHLGKKASISMTLDVLSGDLNTVADLLDGINRELSAKQIFTQPLQQNLVVIDQSQLHLAATPKSIYKSGGDGTAIEEINKAATESSAFGRNIREKTGRNIGGKFYGHLTLDGNTDNLSGDLEFNVSRGTWESYTFDEARIKSDLKNGTFEVETAYVKKGDGTISLQGHMDLRSDISAEITASNMPIDFLSLIIGKGKPFDGKFNMDVSIRGRTASPSATAIVAANNINIGGVKLDSVDSQLSYGNNTLFFNKMLLSRNGRSASVGGALPFNKNSIAVAATLEGQTLGLLTLLSPDIEWITGAGTARVMVTGTISHPVFNGYLALSDVAIYMKMLDSNLESLNSRLNVGGNTISIESFSANWIGKWTQNKSNSVVVSGEADLDGLFSDSRTMNLALFLKDSSYTLDVPNFYKGDLDIKGVSLRGPLSFDPERSRNPKLSGIYSLSNGVIALPDMSKRSDARPIDLDLTLNILKNTYVSAGDTSLISTDLSNLILYLAIEGPGIVFSGNLNEPKISGKAVLKNGTVNILNREFSLIDVDRQKEIYTTALDKVKENSAVFSGGSMPNLSLSSEIRIKSTETIAGETPSSPPTYKTTNVLVVSRISGVPYAKTQEEGINIAFDSFIEDTTKQPAELSPSGYDDDQVKVLLLPDFIKGSLAANEKGMTDVTANDVLADYLNSRLNSYLLRNVERNLAKSFDLENLTLEYNFGRDIKNMMAEKEEPAFITPGDPETQYGVGAMKGFFDRFYIDMRYAQAAPEQALVNNSVFDYQLTYKLSPIISVVYYREPLSYIEQQSDYYKVTLKAGYEL